MSNHKQMMKLLSKSPQDTEDIGIILAKNLPQGMTLALYGTLAAGKTALSKALFEARGYHNQSSSPTYTIINEYIKGTMRAYHMDAYRLSDSQELEYTGYRDFSEDPDTDIIVIEWADVVESGIYTDRLLKVRLERTQSDNERVLTIETENPELYSRLTEELNAYLSN